MTINPDGRQQSLGAIPGSREPDPSCTGSGPTGFDPERGEHPLALMESLLGAADEVEGWGAGLEAAIMRKSAAKLRSMYDALATIADVWTLPAIERHPSGDQWHCQHEEAVFSASAFAREAIAMEARRGETPKSGSTAEGGDSAGAKHIAKPPVTP